MLRDVAEDVAAFVAVGLFLFACFVACALLAT